MRKPFTKKFCFSESDETRLSRTQGELQSDLMKERDIYVSQYSTKRNDAEVFWGLEMDGNLLDIKKMGQGSDLDEDLFAETPRKVLDKYLLKDLIVKAVSDEMDDLENEIKAPRSILSLKKISHGFYDQCASVTTEKMVKSLPRERMNNPPSISFKYYSSTDLVETEIGIAFKEMDRKVDACLKVEDVISSSSLSSNCKTMRDQYDHFVESNSGNLMELYNHYRPLADGCSLKEFVMKFLLDIQIEIDLKKVPMNKILYLEKFFIDRYFKVLKNKIFVRVIEKDLIKNLLKIFVPASQMECLNSLEFSVNKINQIYYEFIVKCWKNKSNDNSNCPSILNLESLKIFKNLEFSEKALKDFYETVCIIIHRIASFLIIRLVSQRFFRMKRVFDHIERLEIPIFEIIQESLNVISLSRKNLKENPGNLYSFNQTMNKLNQKFFSDSRLDLFLITKYVKYREMREYLGRKRKSEFIKPRRNDEKLKKVYKRIMKHSISKFKLNLKIKAKKKPKISPKKQSFEMIRFGDVDEDNINESKMFISESEEDNHWLNTSLKSNEINKSNWMKGLLETTNLQIETLINISPKSNSKVQSKRAKKLTSKQKEMQFYENYFHPLAKERKIPIDHFYDPLKQKYRNSKYKSFTITYFKQLLASDLFLFEVKDYLKGDRILLDVIYEYPNLLKDLFQGCEMILLDQHKAKAKFLWTCYEFYFALFYFKNKFNL